MLTLLPVFCPPVPAVRPASWPAKDTPAPIGGCFDSSWSHSGLGLPNAPGLRVGLDGPAVDGCEGYVPALECCSCARRLGPTLLALTPEAVAGLSGSTQHGMARYAAQHVWHM